MLVSHSHPAVLFHTPYQTGKALSAVHTVSCKFSYFSLIYRLLSGMCSVSSGIADVGLSCKVDSCRYFRPISLSSTDG